MCVLVEREEYLDALSSLLPSQAPGDGHVVLLGGEAGIGKTSLVAALLETGPAVVVRRGWCDSVTTAAALGPLAEALPELEAAIEAATPERRRLLFRDALALLSEQPTLLVLEDLHWADEATLGFVRYLGRRVAGLPLLVVATFRDDDPSTTALTGVLGDLAALPAVTRMRLRPLSPEAVATLVGTTSGTSGVRPGSLHRRTGGNPFFVTEVLATGSTELPATVRDAVLARVHQLSGEARDVLGAAAVLGPQAELAMVVAVSGRPGAAVDECVARGVLVADPDTGALTFRHDVARETVEAALPPAERDRMHAVALAELLAAGSRDHRRLAYHAEGCGDRPTALEHGVAAAERSARLGAHREAAELYRRALRFADLLSLEQGAALHEALSYECYLTDRIEEASASRRSALSLREETGDLVAVGDDQRWLSRLSWFGGHGDDALRYADLAVRTLEPLPPGRALAMAYSNRAQLAMLHADEDEAVEWGMRAARIARALGDREVESHALNNVGTAQLQGTDAVNGLARLHQALDIALVDDLHEHAARAYTNMVSSLVCLHRYREADQLLRTGVDYCADRDLDSWQSYMSSWRARSWFEQGRYDDAARAADEVLGRSDVALVAQIPARTVLAHLAARRGEPQAEQLLDEALALALPTGEEQRIVPVAFARAEAAWLAGDPGRVAAELVVVRDLPAGELDTWQRGELAWWSRTAGVDAEAAGTFPEPFVAMLDGRWSDAAAAWDDLGCAPWAAVARSLAPGLDEARAAMAVLDEQRAVAVRAAVLRDRHALGLPVPRQPRRPAAGNPAGLTARELEVLALLAEGLTNAELARRLFLSEKTVDHHVSAVLRKLGEPSRARAVAASHERGLIAKPGRTPDVADPSSTV